MLDALGRPSRAILIVGPVKHLKGKVLNIGLTSDLVSDGVVVGEQGPHLSLSPRYGCQRQPTIRRQACYPRRTDLLQCIQQLHEDPRTLLGAILIGNAELDGPEAAWDDETVRAETR